MPTPDTNTPQVGSYNSRRVCYVTVTTEEGSEPWWKGVNSEFITHSIYNISPPLGDMSKQPFSQKVPAELLSLSSLFSAMQPASRTHQSSTNTQPSPFVYYAAPEDVSSGGIRNKYANAEDWFVNLNLGLN